MTLHKNYSLKKFNTFGVDVNAECFVEIDNEEELVEYLSQKEFIKNQLLILGGGSNILFTKNYDGTVVKYLPHSINIIEETGKEILLEVEAGMQWDDLVLFCVKNKYYGIENMSLIPGTVGAAPIQNIGAYGVELKDVFEYLEGYVIDSCEKKIFNKIDCKFGYRDSLFKKELKRNFIITKVALRFSKEKKINLAYKALKEALSNKSENVDIEDISDAVRKIRTSKLPDPVKYGNAGSFFKNPEITGKHFKELIDNYNDLVYFEQGNGLYKIPAGWLIEKCGYKGKRIGNVGTYENQALVIINYGGASGKEVIDFARLIQNEVERKFKIVLETEVNIL